MIQYIQERRTNKKNSLIKLLIIYNDNLILSLKAVYFFNVNQLEEGGDTMIKVFIFIYILVLSVNAIYRMYLLLIEFINYIKNNNK